MGFGSEPLLGCQAEANTTQPPLAAAPEVGAAHVVNLGLPAAGLPQACAQPQQLYTSIDPSTTLSMPADAAGNAFFRAGPRKATNRRWIQVLTGAYAVALLFAVILAGFAGSDEYAEMRRRDPLVRTAGDPCRGECAAGALLTP